MKHKTIVPSGANHIRYDGTTQAFDGKDNHNQYFDNLKYHQEKRAEFSDYGATRVAPPLHYTQVFQSNFSSQEDFNNQWSTGLPWGKFYPEPDHHGCWFPNSALGNQEVDECIRLENGILKLDTVINSKQFNINTDPSIPTWQKEKLLSENPEYYGSSFTIPRKAGNVYTKEKWKYGWFEATIKLPISSWQWSSFWMFGKGECWPPEIDIFEAFTKDNDHNIHPVPNIHIGTKKFDPNQEKPVEGCSSLDWREHKGWLTPRMERGASMANQMKLFAGPYRFVQYVCHWTEDFVRIYFDGILYREYACEDIDPLYKDSDIAMNIVLGNNLQKDGTEYYDKEKTWNLLPKFVDYNQSSPADISTLYVHNVRVYQEQ